MIKLLSTIWYGVIPVTAWVILLRHDFKIWEMIPIFLSLGILFFHAYKELKFWWNQE